MTPHPAPASARLPYLLLVPATLALAVALGYPLVRQVVLSFQEFGLAQQFGQPAEWIGLQNYRDLITDHYLWVVTLRSLVFCFVNAAATMAIGVGLALLMRHMAKPIRLMLQTGLLLAWAMPVVASLTVWQWLFDTQYGVINYLLTRIGLDYEGHSWLLEPLSFFFVATVIIVWMSVPFVAFTVYAALTQVPEEMIEAAEIDGAGPAQRLRPRDPADDPAGAAGRRAAPGDLGPAGVHPDLHPPEGRRQHPRHQPARHLHLPARHRRRSVRHGGRGRDLHAVPHRDRHRAVRPLDAQAREGSLMARTPRRSLRITANVVGVVAFLVAIFPVYWMVNSSFLDRNEIRNPTPTWVPFGGNLDNYRTVFEGDQFLDALKMSLIVTVLTVTVAVVFAFVAAVAVSRFRFRGRMSFVITLLVIQMIPVEGLFISQYKMLEAADLLNTVVGLTLVYVALVLPFTIWTLRGFVAGVPYELEEAAMIDGCSRTQAFFRVTFPLLAPGLVATGVFGFIQAWNEFTLALVVMTKEESRTLPLWLTTFTDVNRGTDWGGIMAGSTLIAIPVVVFFLLVQGRMVAGPDLRGGEGMTRRRAARARRAAAGIPGYDAARRLGRAVRRGPRWRLPLRQQHRRRPGRRRRADRVDPRDRAATP